MCGLAPRPLRRGGFCWLGQRALDAQNTATPGRSAGELVPTTLPGSKPHGSLTTSQASSVTRRTALLPPGPSLAPALCGLGLQLEAWLREDGRRPWASTRPHQEVEN